VIRAFALAAALFSCGCVAAGQPLTPAQYARIVGGAAQGLHQAARAGKESKRLAQVALGRLPGRAVVQSGAGAPPLTVDNRGLLRALRDEVARGPSGIMSAAQVLRNLQRNLEIDVTPAPADARGVLAAVLRRREFRPSRWEQLRERFYQWLARVIDAILGLLPDLGLPATTLRVIALIVLAVAGAIALLLVLRLVMTMASRPRKASLPAAVSRAAVKPHSAWVAEADEALRSGDYRGALRALHMAALMKLDEAGHIRFMESRTDGRFTRALRDGGRHELASALSALSLVFAAAWYGAAPAGPQEYAAAQEHWHRLEALAAA